MNFQITLLHQLDNVEAPIKLKICSKEPSSDPITYTLTKQGFGDPWCSKKFN